LPGLGESLISPRAGKLRRSLDDSAGLMAMAVGAIGIDCGRMTGLNRPAVGS
jgi:hypothetical protein